MTQHSSPETEPLADMVQCPKCQWWTNSPKFHAETCPADRPYPVPDDRRHAQQPASPVTEQLFQSCLSELTEGHLALDRLGAPREVQEGDVIRECLIAERISSVAQCAPDSLSEQQRHAQYVHVAWRWRPKGATLWIYNPESSWLAEHDDDIESEPLYALTSTVPEPVENTEGGA